VSKGALRKGRDSGTTPVGAGNPVLVESSPPNAVVSQTFRRCLAPPPDLGRTDVDPAPAVGCIRAGSARQPVRGLAPTEDVVTSSTIASERARDTKGVRRAG